MISDPCRVISDPRNQTFRSRLSFPDHSSLITLNSPPYQPWVHRVAVLTACAVLLPITVGALVTTMKWGMAFADWPTSDGHGMLVYPWLRDFRANPNKFAEHGHRLAGVLIGCLSILLAVTAWRMEDRRWVRWLGASILLGVIVQGLMGGNRVLRDDPRWALVHGSFAAVVFALMGGMALVTSRRWRELWTTAGSPAGTARGASAVMDDVVSDMFRPLVMAAPFILALQYVLGGFVRHLGTALHEHLGGAILAGLVGLAASVGGARSPSPLVARLGRVFGVVLFVQIALGAGAWVTRFGFPMMGYVAVNGATSQALFRTGHAVTGMLLMMTAVLLAVSVKAVERSLGRGGLAGVEALPAASGARLAGGGA